MLRGHGGGIHFPEAETFKGQSVLPRSHAVQCRDDVDETAVERNIASGVLCEEDKGDMCQGLVRIPPCPPDVGGKIADAAIESGLSDCFLHVGTGKNSNMVENGAILHAIRFADCGTLRV